MGKPNGASEPQKKVKGDISIKQEAIITLKAQFTPSGERETCVSDVIMNYPFNRKGV